MEMTTPLADLLSVYAVTPDGFDPDLHQARLEAAFAAGLRCIQLRDKAASPEQLQRLAERWRHITAAHGALLFINDQADLAAAVGADGVHLGPSDEPLSAVRARHPHLLLGGSTSSPDRALLLAGQGADYLGIGAIFDASATKPDARHHRGPDLLRQLRLLPELDHLPLVAIGGITLHNASACFEAGASGVAAVRALLGAPDPAAAVTTLLRLRYESGGTSSSAR
jgi:thiamine-phosphate pyrophosphorylase